MQREGDSKWSVTRKEGETWVTEEREEGRRGKVFSAKRVFHRFKSNSPPPPNFPTKVFQSGRKIGKRLLLVIKEESLKKQSERRN